MRVKDIQRWAGHHADSTHQVPAMRQELAAPFKTLLLAQRASLLEQLASLRGGAAGRAEASSEHFGQPDDSTAQLSTERELEFALDARESAELNQIQAALDRIAAGTYGACHDCGTDIPMARLHAAPEATRCVACQAATESRPGQVSPAS